MKKTLEKTIDLLILGSLFIGFVIAIIKIILQANL
jgi:hypothetical protein